MENGMTIRNYRELFIDINPIFLSVIWRSLWNLSLSYFGKSSAYWVQYIHAHVSKHV